MKRKWYTKKTKKHKKQSPNHHTSTSLDKKTIVMIFIVLS